MAEFSKTSALSENRRPEWAECPTQTVKQFDQQNFSLGAFADGSLRELTDPISNSALFLRELELLRAIRIIQHLNGLPDEGEVYHGSVTLTTGGANSPARLSSPTVHRRIHGHEMKGLIIRTVESPNPDLMIGVVPGQLCPLLADFTVVPIVPEHTVLLLNKSALLEKGGQLPTLKPHPFEKTLDLTTKAETGDVSSLPKVLRQAKPQHPLTPAQVSELLKLRNLSSDQLEKLTEQQCQSAVIMYINGRSSEIIQFALKHGEPGLRRFIQANPTKDAGMLRDYFLTRRLHRLKLTQLESKADEVIVGAKSDFQRAKLLCNLIQYSKRHFSSV